LVDLFLNPKRVPPVVDQAIEIGAPVLWMQEGVIHHEAAEKAKAAGLTVVMDKCTKHEHKNMLGDPKAPE
jgi:predicted CoA-binding protein